MNFELYSFEKKWGGIEKRSWNSFVFTLQNTSRHQRLKGHTISPSHFYSLFMVFKIKITSNLRLYSNDFLNQKESIGKGKVDFFSKVIPKWFSGNAFCLLFIFVSFYYLNPKIFIAEDFCGLPNEDVYFFKWLEACL